MPAQELKLPQIAEQEADGTIAFNAGAISTVASTSQSYMIFYLTQEDEQNGYGTVIQLDEQHTAAIYPDLNPEYTYLFFKDEQGQLQTLLWCIEFATRNPDGLYVAQAKVHGRGVTQADMDRFNQIMVAQPAGQTGQPSHDLAESYSATPAPQAPASPSPAIASPAFTAAPAPAPTIEVTPPTPAATPQWNTPAASAVISPVSTPQPTAPINTETPSLPDLNLPPLPDLNQPSTPAPQPEASAQPASLADLGLAPSPIVPTKPTPQPSTEPAAQTTPQPLDLPPLPDLPSAVQPVIEPAAQQPAPSPAPQPVSFPTLPPLPTLPATPQPDLAAPAPAPLAPVSQVELPPLPPLPSLPIQPDQLDISQPAAAQPTPQPAPEKNPVGRPPKPLMSDAAWRVDQTDFAWAKAISRESIESHKDELRAKLQSQIERNQPELLQNPTFQPALDQAFQAICQAYELAPTARQDLLKSLLNGRVVENIASQLH